MGKSYREFKTALKKEKGIDAKLMLLSQERKKLAHEYDIKLQRLDDDECDLLGLKRSDER